MTTHHEDGTSTPEETTDIMRGSQEMLDLEEKANAARLIGNFFGLKYEQFWTYTVLPNMIREKILSLHGEILKLTIEVAGKESEFKNRMLDFYTDLMHPEFGSAWCEPDGELYKASHSQDARIQELETLCQSQARDIRVLEEMNRNLRFAMTGHHPKS